MIDHHHDRHQDNHCTPGALRVRSCVPYRWASAHSKCVCDGGGWCPPSPEYHQQPFTGQQFEPPTMTPNSLVAQRDVGFPNFNGFGRFDPRRSAGSLSLDSIMLKSLVLLKRNTSLYMTIQTLKSRQQIHKEDGGLYRGLCVRIRVN
jgi:hypothetical protein